MSKGRLEAFSDGLLAIIITSTCICSIVDRTCRLYNHCHHVACPRSSSREHV